MPYRKRTNRVKANLWLRKAMADVGITSLGELSQISGVDAGSISRYFNLSRRPSIDVIEPLAVALKVRPEVIMLVLGATVEDYDCC